MAACLRSARTRSCPPAVRRSRWTPPTACELVGELALPPDREPLATLVCLHPLPTHGGMMDSHVFRKAAFRLPALAGVAVLRFNTRGTSSLQGTSEGAFDDAVGERYDVAAAIEYAEFHDLPNIWAAGLVLRHRPRADVRPRPGRAGGDPAVPAAAVQRPRAPGRLGRVGQAADRPGARARRLPAAAGGPGAVRGGAAGRGGRRRRREAPVGRGRRDRCWTWSSRGSPPRSTYRCRPSGTARWRRPTRAPTPTAPPRPSRTSRASGSAWRGTHTSRTSRVIAAAVGIASSAPITPSSAVPTSAAMTMIEPGRLTERDITRG